MLRLMCRDEEKFLQQHEEKGENFIVSCLSECEGTGARSANNNFTGNIISVIIIVRRQDRRAAKNVFTPVTYQQVQE